MSDKDIKYRIQQMSKKLIPEGAQLFLYGSRARGDNRPDSDWDLLVLLPKDSITPDDYANISYPLTELGWKLSQSINPIMYTQKEWKHNSFTPFYHNVQHDAIRLQ